MKLGSLLTVRCRHRSMAIPAFRSTALVPTAKRPLAPTHFYACKIVIPTAKRPLAPTHFYACKIVIPTAKRPLASSFAATLYQVHHSCRCWKIQTSYWSIMMSGRVTLPTTIDRRWEDQMIFPSVSPNH